MLEMDFFCRRKQKQIFAKNSHHHPGDLQHQGFWGGGALFSPSAVAWMIRNCWSSSADTRCASLVICVCGGQEDRVSCGAMDREQVGVGDMDGGVKVGNARPWRAGLPISWENNNSLRVGERREKVKGVL